MYIENEESSEIMDQLDKAMKNLAKSFSDLNNGAIQKVVDSLTKMTEEIKSMDGYVGAYKGHDIYYMIPDNYFANKKANDAQDVYWLLTDTDILVHRGKAIGKVTGKQVTPIKQVDIFEHYPAYQKQDRQAEIEKMKVALAQGASKRGNTGVKTVTERKSVEYYMQHTIDVLNAGLYYGEEQLKKLSAMHGQ